MSSERSTIQSSIPPVARPSLLISPINIAALVMAVLTIIVLSFAITPSNDDFKHYWQASIDLRRSGDPYAQRDPANNGVPNDPPTNIKRDDYIYPPMLAILIQPLGFLPLEQAQLIWLWINAGLLGALIVFSIRAIGSPMIRRYWGVIALLVLLAPPTNTNLLIGQLGIAMGLLTVAGILLTPKAPRWAGLLLALAGLIKIYPAVTALAYLFQRRSVLIWTMLGGAILSAISLLVYGIEPYLIYLDRILLHNRLPYPLAAEANISFAGMWQRLFTTNKYAIPLVDAPEFATALSVATAAALLAICLWMTRKLSPEAHPALGPSIWVCATLLAWPASGYYNLVVLLLPLLLLERTLAQQNDRSGRIWLLLSIALLCIPPAWSASVPALYNAVHTGLGILFLTPALYGQCLVLWLLIRIARHWPSA